MNLWIFAKVRQTYKNSIQYYKILQNGFGESKWTGFSSLVNTLTDNEIKFIIHERDSFIHLHTSFYIKANSIFLLERKIHWTCSFIKWIAMNANRIYLQKFIHKIKFSLSLFPPLESSGLRVNWSTPEQSIDIGWQPWSSFTEGKDINEFFFLPNNYYWNWNQYFVQLEICFSLM